MTGSTVHRRTKRKGSLEFSLRLLYAETLNLCVPFGLARSLIVECFKYLTAELAVAAQLEPADMARAASAGFRHVVNNRPDAEEIGQPTNESIQQAAEAAGLDYHYLPVITGCLTDEDVVRFSDLASGFSGPVLMFCRSGTRCTHLWSLQQAQQGQLGLKQILSTASLAGYDMRALLPRLQALAVRGSVHYEM